MSCPTQTRSSNVAEMSCEKDTYPGRLTRLRKLFENQSPFYFVTFNTHNRRAILASIELHEAFVQFCQSGLPRGVVVGRYVLMPDHVHLFVALNPHGIRLPDWIRTLKTVLGKSLLRQSHDKPHWQPGFFDHALRSGESYSQKWEYVRMNPVRAGFSLQPDEWPYQGELATLSYD